MTPDVLDPRPETETLIETALAKPFTRLLDLGTGSGAIAVTLLAERPEATGLAVDVCPAALTVARRNALAMGVAPRLNLHLSDWFSDVAGPFDLIVSNPPYIAEDEIPGLAPEVRLYEPQIALTPGGDGLDAYRTIAAQVCGHLVPGGAVVLEIGPTQAAAVCSLLLAAGLQAPAVVHDLDGRDRVICAHRPG